jgi:predicted membrane protein
MSGNGKTGFALLLIALGALIVLSKLGILGGIIGLIIPVAMLGLGYYGIKSGNKFFGWLLFIVGLFILLGKLSGLIWILFAVGFIVYGVTMLKKKNSSVH